MVFDYSRERERGIRNQMLLVSFTKLRRVTPFLSRGNQLPPFSSCSHERFTWNFTTFPFFEILDIQTRRDVLPLRITKQI
ncbi:hypothetical protein OIU74_001145 [Salix koriyanagi]|uniref:Uncharacterized protein n=1 Tax=Salix koriyanagi TaxID=2511006 RepID=A0A9Q1AMQ2_9ROSI|nr:hypothetical protein OIU74_001145 [Salix koriyanagi]